MTRFDDDPVFLFLHEWNLPTDARGFLVWLRNAGVTLAEFRTYPAWQDAPASLRDELEALEPEA